MSTTSKQEIFKPNPWEYDLPDGMTLECGYIHPRANVRLLWLTVIQGILVSWRAGSMSTKRLYDEDFLLLCKLADLDPDSVRKENGCMGPYDNRHMERSESQRKIYERTMRERFPSEIKKRNSK